MISRVKSVSEKASGILAAVMQQLPDQKVPD
jgi:hypothetical protein